MMADNYLERHREEYEKRKAVWLSKKRHMPSKDTVDKSLKPRPEQEACENF